MEDEIKLITHEEARDLVNNGRPRGQYDSIWEPFGKFYYITTDKNGDTLYVGIDNSDGHCWVEEFYTISGCMAWLRGEMEVG